MSRSPYGERGLKSEPDDARLREARRSPYGERGLKYVGCSFRVLLFLSLSLRRAWIEICQLRYAHDQWLHVALLTESVD